MSAVLLGQTVERYLRQYPNEWTQKTYRRSLQLLVEYIGSDVAVCSITCEVVEDWFSGLSSRQVLYENHPTRPEVAKSLSPYSLNNTMRSVKAFFNWCVARRLLELSPARFLRVKLPRRSRRSKAIPHEVLHSMFDYLRTKPDFFRYRDGAILSLFTTFGVRNNEVVSLRLSDVDWSNGWIVFRAKGNRDLDLPLTGDVGLVLRRWCDVRSGLLIDPLHDFLFVTTRTEPGKAHQPITTAGVQSLLFRLSEHVCGQRWGPHSIRHWKGQSLADRQVSPKLIQQLLGHTDIQTTLDFYCNQDDVRLRRLIDRHALVAGIE